MLPTLSANVPLSEATLEVARSADDCYRLLCDLESVPRWVGGVASVRIVELDDSHRPALVEFVGMPSRASFAYRLRYSYDVDERLIRWFSISEDVVELAGEAQATPIDEHRCRVRYGVRTAAGPELPGWAQESVVAEAAESIASSFRRFALAQIPGSQPG